MHLADRELRIEGDCSILTKALERSKTLPDGNLAAAREQAGLIDEFERDHGPLPVPHADVCLTSSCTDQRAYDEQREQTGVAAIVVQTHAMSVLDAVRDDVDADVAIYDEADALPGVAAGYAEARVLPLDLAAVQHRHAPPGLADAVAAFETWAARTLDRDAVVFKQQATEAVRHAAAIRATLRDLTAETRATCRAALAPSSRSIRVSPIAAPR